MTFRNVIGSQSQEETMIRPPPEQRAEMSAFIDAKEPGLLDDLGIQRVVTMCQRGHGPLENGDCPDCGYAT